MEAPAEQGMTMHNSGPGRGRRGVIVNAAILGVAAALIYAGFILLVYLRG